MDSLVLLRRLHPLHGIEVNGWVLEDDRCVLVVAVCYGTWQLLILVGGGLIATLIPRGLTSHSVRRCGVLRGQHGIECCHVWLKLNFRGSLCDVLEAVSVLLRSRRHLQCRWKCR